MDKVPEEGAFLGGVVRGAKAAGKLAKLAGKAAARKGVIKATGQAAKVFAKAGRFATKLPSKIKSEAVKEIARRGGPKAAGKALVKKIVRDQAYVQSKKVVKNFIADSQNSRMERMKDDVRKSGIALSLMKEAERKNLIPKGSTPNLYNLERAVLQNKDLKAIEKEDKERQEKLDKARKEGLRGAEALFAGRAQRYKTNCKVKKMKKDCAACPPRPVGCLEYYPGRQPKWMKERCPGVLKRKDCN